ncbi:hypothetical protein F511_03370 [Dorcoceras hygrometricum]|uniref:(S)-ureidoglycine aminohydrolase cupin domain-containing protein n=1 Tax=Dorcoceras hygrometricum TaxID=472368 RepID=A0A2Z7BF99_9LAMI|nr:hypothetical protein F511_03370 [Dorcoceras hygrometricum]
MATFVGTSPVTAAAAASFPNLHSLKTLTKSHVCLRHSGRIGASTGLTYRRRLASRGAKTMASATTETEKSGIKIVRNPTDSKLSDLGVRSWPKWGCPPSKFPWTYSSTETCYLLKGKVKVYPDGSDEAVEIGAGDLVVFPKGMSCTWDVSETVDKHYQFE